MFAAGFEGLSKGGEGMRKCEEICDDGKEEIGIV